jgi:hypothetical protein
VAIVFEPRIVAAVSNSPEDLGPGGAGASAVPGFAADGSMRAV